MVEDTVLSFMTNNRLAKAEGKGQASKSSIMK